MPPDVTRVPISPPIGIQPTAVEQTNPADVGTSTSEYKLAVIAGVAGAILTGLVATFASLKESMPDVGWIATAVVILGAIATAILPMLRYLAGRANIKVALANVEAARVLAAATPAATAAAMAGAALRPTVTPTQVVHPPSF